MLDDMRVYNEPCEMATDDHGRPHSFLWRGREYAVIKLIEDWETMRPWWRADDQLPDAVDYKVVHYRVRASSPKGQGIIEVRQQYEGWYVTGVVD